MTNRHRKYKIFRYSLVKEAKALENNIINYDSPEYKRSRKAYTAQCAVEYFGSLLVTDIFLVKLPGHIAINFTGEAYMGETLTVKTAVSQDAARFCGTVGGRNCFCGRITF